MTATLNGTAIERWIMHWPRYGCARVEVWLAQGEVPSGAQTLTREGLSLNLGVLRSGLDAVDKPHATLVLGVGWTKSIDSPISFQADNGVRLLAVLRKLASLSGEPIEYPSDSPIGEYYECIASRPGEPVRILDALNDLVRHGYCQNWRVDADGVLRFGERTAQQVTARATQMAINRGLGFVTYGLDDPAQFVPGNTMPDGSVVDRVDIRERDGKLEADVYTQGSDVGNIRDMIRRIVAHELGDRCRTYIVVTCRADGRCDLKPPADAQHLPEMKNIEQWITGGATFRAKDGDEAIVEFRDEKKTRPVITGFRRASGTSFPDMARVGDLTQAGGIGTRIQFAQAPSGTPLFLVTAAGVPAPPPYWVSFGDVPPTALAASPLFGCITSGTTLLGAKRS